MTDARGKPRVQTVNSLPSETVQADAPQADIREIMKRHGATGVVDHLSQVEGVYMDVSKFTDFADVMRTVRQAEMEFMQLPPGVREAFKNDPAEWLDAAHDGISEAQRDRLVKEGFLEASAEALPPEPPSAETTTAPAED